MKTDARERRSRDTRPQPAWRGADPATPCKVAHPPSAMKRLALLLPLLALAACAGPARALECWGEIRPDGTVVWHDQTHSRALLIAEHGSHCVDEGTDAMAQGKQEKDAFIDARRFLAVCRDSGEDDVRPPTLIANLDARLLLDSIVSSFSVDSTTNAIDVELADFKLADYRPRGGPWPRWEEPDVGDPPGEPHGEEVETLRSSFRLSAGRRVCFGNYAFGLSFAACPRERIPEEILERIGPPGTAPGPFFVVRRTCHPSVRRIFPDHPLRCILLPASFPGAPEAFPFSLGKFLLWPVPAKKN